MNAQDMYNCVILLNSVLNDSYLCTYMTYYIHLCSDVHFEINLGVQKCFFTSQILAFEMEVYVPVPLKSLQEI